VQYARASGLLARAVGILSHWRISSRVSHRPDGRWEWDAIHRLLPGLRTPSRGVTRSTGAN